MTPSVGYARLSCELVESDTLELQATGEHTRALVDSLPLEHVSSVLDVGCGSGYLARALGRRMTSNAVIRGVDSCSGHIEDARTKAPDDRHRYEVLDFFGDLSRHEGRYDLVVEKYVLMSVFPFQRGQDFIQRMRRCAKPGGTVALIEADINFGQDRQPPAPSPLSRVLPEIVKFYRKNEMIDWRCGPQTYGRMKQAGLLDVRVQIADGRIIAGGQPSALVTHANIGIEELIEPCLHRPGTSVPLELVARQWREYFNNPHGLVYNPIFVCAGTA